MILEYAGEGRDFTLPDISNVWRIFIYGPEAGKPEASKQEDRSQKLEARLDWYTLLHHPALEIKFTVST